MMRMLTAPMRMAMAMLLRFLPKMRVK